MISPRSLYNAFKELQRFLGEIETYDLTVSDSEIITVDVTVSKIEFS